MEVRRWARRALRWALDRVEDRGRFTLVRELIDDHQYDAASVILNGLRVEFGDSDTDVVACAALLEQFKPKRAG